MRNLEVIDMFCTITTMQADLIRTLMTELEHQDQISAAFKEDCQRAAGSIEDLLDRTEYNCRGIADSE